MQSLKQILELSHTGNATIRSMEGLRGFAVFLVFLVHYALFIEPWVLPGSVTHQFLSGLRTIGGDGVDLFFVLSGFLIYGMLIKKPRPFGRYAARRIQRLYPTFIVVLMAYLALSYIFPNVSKIPTEPVDAAIFIVQNFLLLPGIFNIEPIVTVAWTLSYEMFFYICTPVLIALLRFRVWPPRYRVIALVTMSIALFAIFTIFGGHVRLLMFFSGMLLFETVENFKISLRRPWGLLALVLFPVVHLMFKHLQIPTAYYIMVLFVLFYILCLDCFTRDQGIAKVFLLTPLRWLGNMSYSYYLVHGLAIRLFVEVLQKIYPANADTTLAPLLLMPLIFSVSLVSSFMLFVLVEKPFSLSTHSTVRK